MDQVFQDGPPASHFRFCPRCGGPAPPVPAGAPFQCPACAFVYYFNPTVAAGALVRDAAGRFLLVRRANEPARGKLALPGGFIDAGERAEDALRRELREEVNLEVGALHFLCSEVNRYVFRGVVYPVVDLFFLTTAHAIDGVAALDEVASLAWYPPGEIDLDQLAFPSVRRAVERALGRPG